jgi:hypothetical protein
VLGSQPDSAATVTGSSINGNALEGYSIRGMGLKAGSAFNYGISGHSGNATAGLLETESVFGAGLEVNIKNVDNGRGGVESTTTGFGPALYGGSINGRGGEFTGKPAQIKLNPSEAITHPATGQKGDFFVDHSGRLWFCKGGTNWKQLA